VRAVGPVVPAACNDAEVTSTDVVLPSRQDPVVRGASELIGGPVGRHARVGGQASIAILLLLTALTCFAGWVQKAPCRVHSWSHEYQYTRMCYSDVYALYFDEQLDKGKIPYLDHAVEYPVLIGGLMEVGSLIAHEAAPADRAPVFFDSTALILACAALVVTYTTARLAGRRRQWDAAMVALAPALVLHAYTNWDLAAVAFGGLGLLAWARDRPSWSGVWLGLGAATKLYPALFLVPLFLLCLREKRLRQWVATAAAAVVTWLVVDVPIWSGRPTSFGRFWSLNRSRAADWDTIWLALQHLTGAAGAPGRYLATVSHLNVVVAAAFLLCLAGISYLAFAAPERPRVPQLVFLVLVAFLLTNKVFSPQYVLWLLPIAVLARPRWPSFLVWQASEAFLLFTRFYYFITYEKPGQGLGYGWFFAAILIRDCVLVWLCVQVIREILRPELDVVRSSGLDDPAGGPLVVAAEALA
jgi:uncharacterized membrane protein